MKIILYQDDCAPDSRQYFEKKFLELLGETMNSFLDTAEHHSPDNDYTNYYRKGNYELSISADDPYWKLCKLKNTQ